MLSPADIRWLAKRALEAALARRPIQKVKYTPRVVGIEQQISLMGIVITGATRAAIVNNKIMKVGQEVRGARVMKISQNSVTFKHKTKTFTKTIKD